MQICRIYETQHFFLYIYSKNIIIKNKITRKKREMKNTKVEKIVQKGYEKLDKFYSRKLKKSKYIKSQYQEDVKIDSSLKVF